MNEHEPVRIVFALFVIAAISAVALQMRATGWGAAAIVTAGLATLVIMAIGRNNEAIRVRAAPMPNETVEKALIAAIAEPVLIVVDGRVRVANAKARALLGEHIVGEDVRLAIRHPLAAERLAPGAPDGTVELAGLGGRDARIELHIATIEGGRRLIQLIDRTERHAVERARVDFVANSSHELRTPLAAILGYVETLAEEKAGGDPEVRARFLEVLLKEARRMQRLIDDLISLSRIEAEKHALPDSRVNIATLVEEVASELRGSDGRARGDIVLALDRDAPLVQGDRTQLSQIVHNLTGNALKYGRSGAPVTITVKRLDSGVRLSVADQGEGIPPEHLPRLTERFYRVDAGRSRAMGGTGLGLSIVKHIVERHRGRLEIDSQVGVGTVVSVTLPSAADALSSKRHSIAT